jgi:glycosyltransferase involved in cell wall biosynthesis
MNPNDTTSEGDMLMMNWCVVIPTYNNAGTLEKVLQDVTAVTPHVIVVNDGSTDSSMQILERFNTVTVVNYSPNRGKGFALRKGFEKAIELGYTHAITLDSDGQHYASDILPFIRKENENPGALIVGARTLPREKLRKGSSFANKFSNFWFKLIAGVSLPDTQSGFRLYPLEPLRNIRFISPRYEFELEVLIRAAWRGVPLMNIPINVFYPEKSERISHFRPFRDFIRISILNTICVFIALFYIKPVTFIRNFRKQNIREFVKKNILHTTDSDEKMTFSVMLGVFMGIVPIWGYQLITAIALAYLLKLNKLIVIVAANISIFPFTAVILYLSFITGGLVMSDANPVAFSLDLSLSGFGNNLVQYFVGAVVLAVAASLFFGLLTYVFLKAFRKKPVILN